MKGGGEEYGLYYDHRLAMIAESELTDNLNGLAKAVAVYEPLGSQEGVISDASRGEGTRNVSLLQAVALSSLQSCLLASSMR